MWLTVAVKCMSNCSCMCILKLKRERRPSQSHTKHIVELLFLLHLETELCDSTTLLHSITTWARLHLVETKKNSRRKVEHDSEKRTEINQVMGKSVPRAQQQFLQPLHSRLVSGITGHAWNAPWQDIDSWKPPASWLEGEQVRNKRGEARMVRRLRFTAHELLVRYNSLCCKQVIL